MRILQLLREALLPLFLLVLLSSLAASAWAQSLSTVAAAGRYPALQPELYQRAIQAGLDNPQ